MYAKNIATFLKYLIKDGKLALNREDEIVRETLVTHGGEVVHPRVRELMGLPRCKSQGASMPSNLEIGLYVFMLATFVGLEVIRKVSPLLHTPLMSLTNAISAISVVGAILIIGTERRHHAQQGAGLHRHHRRRHQHRQRLPDHRPHAEDVQEARRRRSNGLTSSITSTSSPARSSSSR